MDYVAYVVNLIAIYATLAMSLNLLVGYTGLISITQAGVYGIGAYVTALLALNATHDLLLTAVLAAVGAVGVSLVVAVPALRLRNEYFLIATLGFQSILYSLFMNLGFTGGPNGLYGIPHPQLFGLTIRSGVGKMALSLALALICYGLARRVTRSPVGRLLRAVREDETAVSSLGKSVFRIKFSIFMFSAIFAGAAGALYTYSLTAIDPVAFSLDESISIITLVIVGGTGSLGGSVLAAVLLIVLPEAMKFLPIADTVAPQLRQIFYGLLLVGFARFRRQGLIGEYQDVLK